MNAARLLAAVALPAVALGLALAGCAKPDPPTITPIAARVTSVSPQGLGLDLKLEAYNPNNIDLSARSLMAKTTLDGQYELPAAMVARPINLPAHKKTVFEVPVSLQWHDLATVAALAASNRDIPYQVDGAVTIGGETLNIDVPFRLTGTVTHQQLVQAAINSLPHIPGLPALH